MAAVRSMVGNPVKGEDFFDREPEQRQVWEVLHSDHVLLLAPRRVGKTSLLFRLKDTAADRSAEAAYLSVADAESEDEFVRKLYAALPELPSGGEVLKRLRQGPLAKFFRRIKKVEAFAFAVEFADLETAPERGWAIAGQALAEALDRHPRQPLLLIDELPVFVLSLVRQDPAGGRARRFLSWFRELRQAHAPTGRLRWLLAGSIGLDTVAARLNLGDTINDLYVLRLGPFDRATADRLLLELAATYSFPLDEGVRAHLLDRIGWLVPYYVQLLFRELRTHCVERQVPATTAAAEEVFEDLLSPSKKTYFDYWRQRLHEELGRPGAEQALVLLNAAAEDPVGATGATLGGVLAEHVPDATSRAAEVLYLLDVLESDGYLVRHGDRYRFRSPLLREFWLRRIVP
jgi:hypothetical protein